MIITKIGIDFDATLSEEDVQEYVIDLIDRGFDIWIVTARFSNEEAKIKKWNWIERQNQQLFEIADKCGISHENIVFTGMKDKIEFLQDRNFLFHLDDSELELELIEESDDECIGVWVNRKDWRETCEEIIRDKFLTFIANNIN